MKRFINRLLSFTALVTLFLFTACDDGDDPAPPDPLALQTSLLINEGNAWILASNASVRKDGFDVSDQFEGFTLSFGDGTFETSNALSTAWPASGTWEYESGNKNFLLRSDGVSMGVTLDESTLTLTFMVSGIEGGRKESLDGEYQFNLISE